MDPPFLPSLLLRLDLSPHVYNAYMSFFPWFKTEPYWEDRMSLFSFLTQWHIERWALWMLDSTRNIRPCIQFVVRCMWNACALWKGCGRTGTMKKQKPFVGILYKQLDGEVSVLTGLLSAHHIWKANCFGATTCKQALISQAFEMNRN